jgi:phage terminase Nu1 subunit (DNA packaging protein)
MYDIDTVVAIRDIIKKEIEIAKDNIVYGVDTQETLHYARGRLNALEALLQELKNLRNREEL